MPKKIHLLYDYIGETGPMPIYTFYEFIAHKIKKDALYLIFSSKYNRYEMRYDVKIDPDIPIDSLYNKTSQIEFKQFMKKNFPEVNIETFPLDFRPKSPMVLFIDTDLGSDCYKAIVHRYGYKENQSFFNPVVRLVSKQKAQKISSIYRRMHREICYCDCFDDISISGKIVDTLCNYVVNTRKKDTLYVSFGNEYNKSQLCNVMKKDILNADIDIPSNLLTESFSSEEFIYFMRDCFPSVEMECVKASGGRSTPYFIAIDTDIGSECYEAIVKRYEDEEGKPLSLSPVLWIMPVRIAKMMYNHC